MNLQEAFNIIWERAKDPVRAYKNPADPGTCAYRAPDGKKCFIGVLIPDELYEPEMDIDIPFNEADTVKLRLDYILKRIGCDISPEHAVQLQSIHDRYEIETWHEVLTLFAESNGLVVPS